MSTPHQQPDPAPTATTPASAPIREAAELPLIHALDDAGAETPRQRRRRWIRGLRDGAVDRAATHRTWFALLLSGTGIAAVALATLVIEDLFTPDPFSFGPLTWLLVPIVLGWFLLYLRAQLEHRRGTFYYVRLLHHAMTDRHELAAVGRGAAHDEVRVLTRWISPHTAHGVIDDLADDLTDLTRELERCFNTDTARTGYHLAPNLLWPSALALGYNVPLPHDAELLELLPTLIDKPLRRGADPRPGREHRRIQHRLHQLEAPLEWRSTARPHTPWPDFARPRAVTSRTRPDARCVLITAELTAEGPPDPPPWPVDVIQRIAVFRHTTAQASLNDYLDDGGTDGPDALRRLPARWVEIDTDPRNARHRAWAGYLRRASLHPMPWDLARPNPSAGPAQRLTVTSSLTYEQFQQCLAVVHPVAAALACYTTIRAALHDHPDAWVLLAFRVPKTVGFAIGQLLATEDKPLRHDPHHRDWSCRQPSCMNPWRRLLPLTYDSVADPRYTIARVHDAQPTVATIATTFTGPAR